MREEIIVSGRMNPYIDPVLNIWHWQIPTYLFLGGLAAGIMFFAALFVIQHKEDEFKTAVKLGPVLVPLALVVGLFMLFLDLKHKLYFWRLYTTIRFESPMSWGAWTLLLITPLSIIWVAMYLEDIGRDWKDKYSWISKAASNLNSWLKKFKWVNTWLQWFLKNKIGLSWVMIVLAVILGIYTGILLSAFNARPLWNTSILGPLFMVSGFSTGAAVIMWMSADKKEKEWFSRADLLLIAIELFFIVHMLMGFRASTEVQIRSAELFLGGEFTAVFWVFVISIGLVIRAILEIIKLKGYKVPVFFPAIMILLGGLIFRFIMVEAGQITRYLY